MDPTPLAHRRAALRVVYFTVFLDLLGFGIILPVLPYYAEKLGADGLWLGALLTSYSAAQLVGAATLGRLSDRYGRRPLLLLSLAGSSVSLVLTGLVADSLPLLAGLRALAGLCGGSISTAQAYIADVTRPEERARYMGLLGAAIGSGFVLGPTLGALLSPFGFSVAAYVAGALAAANLGFALFRLPEPGGARRPRRAAGMARAPRRPGPLYLLGAAFLTTFAFVVMETTLAYLGAARFGLTGRSFGLLLAYMGVLLILVQGGLIGPLSRRFGERSLALCGTSMLGLGLVLIPFAPSLLALTVPIGVLALGRGLTTPSISTLLSRLGGAGEQGGLLGLGQSASAAARALGPVLAGWLYDLGPARPYYAGGALALLATVAVSLVPRPEAVPDSAPGITSDSGAGVD